MELKSEKFNKYLIEFDKMEDAPYGVLATIFSPNGLSFGRHGPFKDKRLAFRWAKKKIASGKFYDQSLDKYPGPSKR